MQFEHEAEPDQLDQAARLEEKARMIGIENSRRLVESMPTGTSGECDGCGGDFARLVNGLCGFCRDAKRGKY